MMHLCIPIVEVEESVEDGRTQKVQKITFNATLMALVRYALDIECGGKKFTIIFIAIEVYIFVF